MVREPQSLTSGGALCLERGGHVSARDPFAVRFSSRSLTSVWFFCRPCRYDFFIVSQAVRSGSVSPTHYNVIYDNSGLKPDHIQRLTYKLCHVYYNWPVSVSVHFSETRKAVAGFLKAFYG